jgi:hypothetical protein
MSLFSTTTFYLDTENTGLDSEIKFITFKETRMKSILGTFLVFVLIAISVIAISGCIFDYSLDVYFDKDIPWYGDCVAGLFTSPVTIPAAVVGYVLIECGHTKPIIK